MGSCSGRGKESWRRSARQRLGLRRLIKGKLYSLLKYFHSILNERVENDKKLDTQRLGFNRLIEERVKREDQIKKAINSLDKKLLSVEKLLLESTSMNGGGGPPGLLLSSPP